MSRNNEEETQGGADQRLLVEALMGEMRRMLRTELGPIHERLDQVENTQREQ